MNIVAKLLLTAIVLAAGVRATASSVYAAVDFPSRTSVFFTEPQMVNLARRVQQRESLYPDWRTFPHVVNVFTPGYFWIVGGIGKATGASIDGLQWIGRGVTIFFSLLGAALVAWAVRRDGRPAMIAAACVTIGSGVALKFGWMVRPDLVADVFGFAGFLAATSSAPIWFGTALMTAGLICKQTAVLYAIAGVLALWWMGRRRRALAAFIGTAVGTLIVLGLIYLAGERRVFADILLEASSPWRWDHWTTIAARLVGRSGDAIVLGVFGVIVWIGALRTGELESVANAKRWLTLLLVAAFLGAVGSAKLGSDVNYYLPLRFVAAAALAGIFERLRSPGVRWGTVSAGVISFPAIILWVLPAWISLQGHEAFNVVRRMKVDIQLREILDVVEVAKTKRVFTNGDEVALRIGNPFIDSFVFKMLVDTGRLKPTVLKERLDHREYDLVVTTAAVDDSNYLDSAFGMPLELAAVIAKRYDLVAQSFYSYYRPKLKAGASK